MAGDEANEFSYSNGLRSNLFVGRECRISEDVDGGVGSGSLWSGMECPSAEVGEDSPSS